ncbi:MAG: DUF1292 domain-containing protein [Bacilli bacterium]|nr:DUF1292 domain-containing protein [Bacilli bacterium]
MKDNYITLKDKEGNKKEYRILMNIEETSNDVNYLVYTDDSVNENGELNVSVSSYVLSDKGNITKFKELETKEEYEFIEKILNSLEE